MCAQSGASGEPEGPSITAPEEEGQNGPCKAETPVPGLLGNTTYGIQHRITPVKEWAHWIWPCCLSGSREAKRSHNYAVSSSMEILFLSPSPLPPVLWHNCSWQGPLK